jgi:phosphinothricin acetyltransferase
MDDLKLELATQADIPAILAIANWAAANTPANFATEPETEASWAETFEKTHERYPWLVARRAGAVTGFAKASPHRARGAYAWTAEVSVYVQPELKGQGIGTALYDRLIPMGIGTALYDRLIPMLRAQGYMLLLAGITPPNPASEKLHAAAGFTRCGTYRKAGWKFGQWHDVGYWELLLQPENATPRELLPVNAVYRL